jgi:hypothetical protein
MRAADTRLELLDDSPAGGGVAEGVEYEAGADDATVTRRRPGPLKALGLGASLTVVGDLLDRPSVAVGIAEEHESAPGEVLDIGNLEPPPRKLVPRSLDVLDHELKTLERARLHLGEPLTDGDRAV